MPDQYIPSVQRDWLHFDLPRFDSPEGFVSRHAVRAWRDFDRTVPRVYADQAEADDQQISGQREVRSFAEQGTLIVHVNGLVIRPVERHVATPLIGDYPVVHDAADNAQHITVKEELRGEAWRVEGNWEKMAMRTAVRRLAMTFEVCQQDRPECAPAGIDQRPCEMMPKDAIALIADFADLRVSRCQLCCLQLDIPANFAVSHRVSRAQYTRTLKIAW